MTKMRLAMGLCVVALLAWTAKAVNAADQPRMTQGLEQAQVKMQYAADVQAQDLDGLAHEVGHLTKLGGTVFSFDDSAAQPTENNFAEIVATKLNDVSIYQLDLPQDLNAAVNHTNGALITSGTAIDSADSNSFVAKRASHQLETGGTQTSADLGDDVRNAADQPAGRLVALEQRPTPKVYGLLEASQSFFSYT